MSTNDFNTLKSNLEQQYGIKCGFGNNKDLTCPCDDGDLSKFPNITFSLDAKQLTIPPQAYLLPKESGCVVLIEGNLDDIDDPEVNEEEPRKEPSTDKPVADKDKTKETEKPAEKKTTFRHRQQRRRGRIVRSRRTQTQSLFEVKKTTPNTVTTQKQKAAPSAAKDKASTTPPAAQQQQTTAQQQQTTAQQQQTTTQQQQTTTTPPDAKKTKQDKLGPEDAFKKGTYIILGSAFLRNYYSIFDAERKVVSFTRVGKTPKGVITKLEIIYLVFGAFILVLFLVFVVCFLRIWLSKKTPIADSSNLDKTLVDRRGTSSHMMLLEQN